MEPSNQTTLCFGGINCDIGYQCFYEECFRGAERLYTIKGGPGTGKSHLMRSIAKSAMAKGEMVRLIHCGSDPKSLDGVYLEKKGIGVLDATAPHATEPSVPGVNGEIWNLGQFWNSERLWGAREEILALQEEKKKGYEAIYHTFGAMRELRLQMRDRLEEALDVGKLEKAAGRTADGLKGSGEGRVKQMRAIGMEGDVTLHDPSEPTMIGIWDEFGCGHRYLEALLTRLEQKGIAYQISYHPIFHDEPQTLVIPGSQIAYTAASESETVRLMHMRRFRDGEAFAHLRPVCRELARMMEGMRNLALERFTEVRNLHFRIERIYTTAMDFEALERFEKKQIAALFGR